MSAIISIAQNSGQVYAGPGQEVAKSIFYMLPIDDATANKTNNPLILPQSGTRYAYEIYLRARVDLAPAAYCNNFKFWYGSGLPANQIITVNEDIVSAYQSPINLLSSRGARINLSTKNSELNSISLNGNLVNVGEYTSYIVAQLEINPNADTGDYQVSFFLSYDEV